ncbi:glycosyltransferase [Alteromonas oceani]|uniref:Glycosyltransferase n=1 Tax=Alteromonas oceani TaxID=2071609 RepID=A0ABV7JT43_9ALTE|nr:glycosyltransferase [Alteromonas oceani]
MDIPLVTIVVPIYNVEKYLHSCLESIFSINSNQFEVILIDDGSTDNSGEIAALFAEKYADISRFIRQTNAGISASRNRGVELASGEWIIFIDSDDLIAPKGMKAVFDALQEFDGDVLAFDWCKYVNGSGKLVEKSVRKNPLISAGIVDGQKYMSEQVESGILNFVTVWDKAYRRKTLLDNAVQFIPGRMHEDVAFTFQLFLHNIKVKYLDVLVVFYRINREGSIMTDYNRGKYRHVLSNVEFLLNEFSRQQVTEILFYDYLVFLAGTVSKGGVTVPIKLIFRLFWTPVSMKKRLVLLALVARNPLMQLRKMRELLYLPNLKFSSRAD